MHFTNLGVKTSWLRNDNDEEILCILTLRIYTTPSPLFVFYSNDYTIDATVIIYMVHLKTVNC